MANEYRADEYDDLDDVEREERWQQEQDEAEERRDAFAAAFDVDISRKPADSAPAAEPRQVQAELQSEADKAKEALERMLSAVAADAAYRMEDAQRRAGLDNLFTTEAAVRGALSDESGFRRLMGAVSMVEASEFNSNGDYSNLAQDLEMYAKSAYPGYADKVRREWLGQVEKHPSPSAPFEMELEDDGFIAVRRAGAEKPLTEPFELRPDRGMVDYGACVPAGGEVFEELRPVLLSPDEPHYADGDVGYYDMSDGPVGSWLLDMDGYFDEGGFERFCAEDCEQAYVALDVYGFKPSWRPSLDWQHEAEKRYYGKDDGGYTQDQIDFMEDVAARERAEEVAGLRPLPVPEDEAPKDAKGFLRLSIEVPGVSVSPDEPDFGL